MRLRRLVARLGRALLGSTLLQAAALVGVAVVVAFALPPKRAESDAGASSTQAAASEPRSSPMVRHVLCKLSIDAATCKRHPANHRAAWTAMAVPTASLTGDGGI